MPMVKAIAPNAPIGAARMIKRDDTEERIRTPSMNCATGSAALAHELQANANSSGEEQHLQDVALGEGADDGAGNDVQRDSPRRSCCAAWVDVGLDARVSMRRASTFMPTPGCQRFTTTRPMISASVVITSK